MSRIPSLAKYTAPNNFVPRNLSWPGEFNNEYGDFCIWSDYNNEFAGSHTSKLIGVNGLSTKFYVTLVEGNIANRVQLVWQENFTSTLGFSQFTIPGLTDLANWESYGFVGLSNGSSFTVKVNSTITFGVATTGRCTGDYGIWNIWTYAGSSPSAQFLIATIDTYEFCS